jgi:hypothetical protein
MLGKPCHSSLGTLQAAQWDGRALRRSLSSNKKHSRSVREGIQIVRRSWPSLLLLSQLGATSLLGWRISRRPLSSARPACWDGGSRGGRCPRPRGTCAPSERIPKSLQVDTPGQRYQPSLNSVQPARWDGGSRAGHRPRPRGTRAPSKRASRSLSILRQPRRTSLGSVQPVRWNARSRGGRCPQPRGSCALFQQNTRFG